MSEIVSPPPRPVEHRCQMPAPFESHEWDNPPGTIRRCTECGRYWHARTPRIPGRACHWVEWVPEWRLSQWLQERRERKQRERWVPPTEDLPHPPPPAAESPCQVPGEHGQPICVRTIEQRPCATCPQAEEVGSEPHR